MELSNRLYAVASMVTAGYTMADIGTDHAYIPIYLIENGIVPFAAAMDIGEGPLSRAREHVAEHGLLEQIDLRLSDGLKELSAWEVQSVVIAGMGGPLMKRILTESREIVSGLKECIFQPQSEIPMFRAFLLEEGFTFLQEEMVLEDGKYYPMMKVKPPENWKERTENCQSRRGAEKRQSWSGTEDWQSWDEAEKQQGWSKVEICYGKLLLENQNPVLKQFLERERELKGQILEKLSAQESESAAQRRSELEKELACIEEGMWYYTGTTIN